MADSITAAAEQNHATRPKGVQIEFVSGEGARFEFLWDDAPDTCAVLSEKLPAQGDAIHAIYSGTQLGVLFDPAIDAPLQNASTCHVPGDLIWMHYPEFSGFGHPLGLRSPHADGHAGTVCADSRFRVRDLRWWRRRVVSVCSPVGPGPVG